MMNNTKQYADSLVANEFAFEIEGQKVTGVFRISDLTTFKLDDKGQVIYLPFSVSKMVQRDGNNAFNTWLQESRATRSKRTVSIVAIDDGIETRRWTVKGAWIQEVSYSDFNDASFEMVSENVTIAFESIEESFPATPA